MSVLDELQQAATVVVDKVAPAVVRIGAGGGRGAGVVVAEGLVLTNAHNLRGAETTVTFSDGQSSTGQVRGVDADGDLAVVAVDTAKRGAIAWASDDASVGTPVFAVTTKGDQGARVTFGLVSAVGQAFRGPRGRRITGSLEHTAPLTRGSSGTPVVDGEGRLVGLNTNRLGEGFYLAIPADEDLRSRVDALTRGEAPERKRLGIALTHSGAAKAMRRSVGLPDRDGLLVRHVEGDGPAGRAGVRAGDLIVEAQGREVATVDDLFEVVDALEDGSSLALKIVRGADEVAVSVTFGPAREEGSA
jgi:serine protease Do